MLIDLGVEWLAFTLGLLESLLLYLLLLMLRSFVLESILMKYLVLALTGIEAISEAMVVLQFLKHRCFGIFSTHSLVFNFDLVQCALINQSLILVVSDLTLFTSFKLLPSLFFNHCSICIKVLTLKSNLLKLLGQSSLLFSFCLFLLFNLSMNLKKAFFTSCLCSLSQSSSIILLLLSASVILSLAAATSFLDFSSFLHEALGFLFLASHVCFSLEFNILRVFSLLELKALSQLCN